MWKKLSTYKEYGGKVKNVRNSSSVSQSFTLDIIDKIKYYLKIKIHNIIASRFLYKTDVKYLIYVRLMSYNHMRP